MSSETQAHASQQAAAAAPVPNHISTNDMRENVVAKGTSDGYLGDNRHWLFWCLEKQPDYLTEYATTSIRAIIETRPNEKKNKKERRVN
jgi:hypothetical protein